MAWRIYLIPFGPLLVSTSSFVLLWRLIIRRKIRVEQVVFGWVLHIIFAAVEGATIAMAWVWPVSPSGLDDHPNIEYHLQATMSLSLTLPAQNDLSLPSMWCIYGLCLEIVWMIYSLATASRKLPRANYSRRGLTLLEVN